MQDSKSSKIGNSGSTVVCYISAIGAAFMATFFDYVRNKDMSAVKKTAIAIREIFEISTKPTSGQSVLAIIVFCVIAALLVCAYQPKETKESFLLGLSVLVVAGLGVPPLEVKSVGISNGAKALNFLPISTAYAQESRISREERMVWIFLDGPGQRQIPEVKVMAYSGASGELIVNTLVFTKFYIMLPAGVNQVEISRLGYRSVSFQINPSQAISAYRLPLKEVKFDSLVNFLGPKSTSIKEDAELTQLLSNSVNQCRKNNSDAAAKFAIEAGINRDKLERDTRRLLCL